MASIHGLRRSNPHPAQTRRVRFTVGGAHLGGMLVLGGALLAALTLLGSSSQPLDHAGAFVAQALGPARASAPLRRSPAPGVDVAIGRTAVAVSHGADRISLSQPGATTAWTRFAHGVRRTTSYGHESIVVTPAKTEQYLTVDRRLGTKTWSWNLKSLNLKPRVGPDGSIGFLRGNLLTGTTIAPVKVYDAAGHDVTPAGARWSLTSNRLSLTLDDASLPLPYVVDPAISYRAGTGVFTGGAGSSVTLTIPAGTRVGDMLVAQIAYKTNQNPTSVPSGWTQADNPKNNQTVTSAVYYHRAVSTDIPGTSTVTWGLAASAEWVGAMFALAGVNTGAPGRQQFQTNNTNQAEDQQVGGTAAGSFILSTFALSSGASTLNYTTPTGMTFLGQGQSTNATPASRVSASADYKTQVTTGNTTQNTTTCSNCVSNGFGVGWQTTWPLETTLPTVSMSAPPVTLRGTATIQGTAAEATSSLDVLFQYSPAGANTWTTYYTGQSTGFTSAPYSAPFNTTTVPDGFYDLRMVARNGAWSSSADDVVSSVYNVRIDNSSPDQDVLSVNELTGAPYEYFDGANTEYYNPVGGSGSFAVTAAPRDVQNAIALVGSYAAGDGSAGPVTLTNPGASAGQLMLAQIGYEMGTGATIVAPSGWTLLGTQNVSTYWGQKVYYKVATSSEPASYVWSNSASGNANLSGGISVWSGVSSTNPIDTWGSAQTTSASITAPSVTTAAACDELVALNGIWSSQSSIDPAPGMTEIYDARSNEPGWDTVSEAAVQTLGAAGATGNKVATLNGSGTASQGDKSNAGFQVALRPNVCVSQVDFPAPAQTGFTGGGNSPTVPPYVSTTYSFDGTNTTEPGAKTIVVHDEAGNTPLSTPFNLKRDVTGPTFASPPTAGGATNTLSVPVATSTATDPGGSGVDATTYVVQRDTGTASNGTCTWNNTWAPVTLVAGNDTTVTAPGCYRYRMSVKDNVSNTGYSAASNQVIVDQTNPSSAGTVTASTASADTYATGSTVFYRPAGGGGSFTVTDTGAADAHSGIGKIRFPGLTGGITPTTTTDVTSAPYSQTYSWTPGATDSGSKTITVYDAAGNSVTTQFALTQDSTAPTSTTTVPAANANYRASTFPTTWSGTATDGSGSGVASVKVSLEDPTGAYWNGTSFLGSSETFTTATGTSAWTWTAPSLTTNGTYTAHVVSTDNVGNVESSSTFTFVYDTTAPTFGSLAITKSGTCNANSFLSGSTLFYNPATTCANAFTLTQPLSDLGGSSASTVQFPAISSLGFAHSLDTASAPFSSSAFGWSAGATYATSPQTQTLTGADGAGNTATSTFTIQQDTTAPTAAFSAPAASSFVRNGVTLAVNASDSGSGLGSVEFRYCPGTSCTYGASTAIATVAAPGPYTTTWNGQPADGQVTILARATDNVGNVTDVSRTVTLDNTAPTFSSAAVDASGTHLTVTLAEAGSGLDTSSTTPASAFSVLRNGSADPVTAVSFLNSTQVRLTLGTRVFDPDSVTVAYSTGGLTTAQQVKDLAGNTLASFTAQTAGTGATASLAQTTVVASPASIVADGSTATTITVTLRNGSGVALTTSGGSVALATNLGTLSAVNDNGNGTYSATLTTTVAGTATVTATLDGSSVTHAATVTASSAPVNGAHSTITSSPSSVVADGTSSSTITVTAKDALDNLVAGQTVTIAQGSGHSTITTVSGTTNASGVATFTVTDTKAESVVYTATIGATNVVGSASVAFVPGPASAAHSVISVVPGSLTADGTSTATVTVQARDANDNNLSAGGGTVTLATSSGSLGAVTDNHNGTYSATLTSPTSSGTATVTGTIGGTTIGHPANVSFTAGAASGGAHGDHGLAGVDPRGRRLDRDGHRPGEGRERQPAHGERRSRHPRRPRVDPRRRHRQRQRQLHRHAHVVAERRHSNDHRHDRRCHHRSPDDDHLRRRRRRCDPFDGDGISHDGDRRRQRHRDAHRHREGRIRERRRRPDGLRQPGWRPFLHQLGERNDERGRSLHDDRLEHARRAGHLQRHHRGHPDPADGRRHLRRPGRCRLPTRRSAPPPAPSSPTEPRPRRSRSQPRTSTTTPSARAAAPSSWLSRAARSAPSPTTTTAPTRPPSPRPRPQAPRRSPARSPAARSGIRSRSPTRRAR